MVLESWGSVGNWQLRVNRDSEEGKRIAGKKLIAVGSTPDDRFLLLDPEEFLRGTGITI